MFPGALVLQSIPAPQLPLPLYLTVDEVTLENVTIGVSDLSLGREGGREEEMEGEGQRGRGGGGGGGGGEGGGGEG